MTPNDLERQAAAILTDAITLTATLAAALKGMQDGDGLFPSSTPGANPEEASIVHDTPADGPESDDDDRDGRTSLTERSALTYDAARAARVQLEKAMGTAEQALRRAAGLSLQWGRPALGSSTIAERLTAIDRDIWCTNCIRHGHRDPRAKGRTVCEFCAQFRHDWKVDPPKEILDLRAAKGRLYETDIRRILARLEADRVAAGKTKRKATAS